jgi:dienelactone hydrolase
MRPFEVLIFLAQLGAWVWLYFRPEADGAAALVLLSPLLILLHVVVERPRWQMGPAYAQAVGLLLLWLGDWLYLLRNGWFLLFGLLHFALAALLPYLLNVPRLPRPTGPYAIGTRSFYLVDGSRSDIFSENGGEPRELMVQVWYPAQRPGRRARRAPFMANFAIGAPAIARKFGFPPFSLRHLGLVQTHVFLDAPPADIGLLPVVTFSHGYMGLSSQNTCQVEELASHGYVVVAPNHTRGAICTVFPDGRVVFGVTAPPDDLPLERAGRLAMKEWAEDLAFVVRRLAEWNGDPAHPFHGRFDLTRLGCFGHSLGGGTAVQFAASFPYCRALLLLDPWLKPLDETTWANPLPQPLLCLTSAGEFGETNGAIAQEIAANCLAGASVAQIAGSGHYDYSDMALMTPFTRMLGATGSINGRRVVRIISHYTLAFFQGALGERPFSPSPAETPFPEVRWLSAPQPKMASPEMVKPSSS